MKPVFRSASFALSSLVLYSLQNVVLEQKLASYNTFALLLLFDLTFLPIVAIGWLVSRANGAGAALPTGGNLIICLVAGALYVIADFCYVSAYTSGGSVMLVTTIVVLFPALSSVVKYFWVGTFPNTYQIVGYLFAVLAVIMVVKGSTS